MNKLIACLSIRPVARHRSLIQTFSSVHLPYQHGRLRKWILNATDRHRTAGYGRRRVP